MHGCMNSCMYMIPVFNLRSQKPIDHEDYSLILISGDALHAVVANELNT